MNTFIKISFIFIAVVTLVLLWFTFFGDIGKNADDQSNQDSYANYPITNDYVTDDQSSKTFTIQTADSQELKTRDFISDADTITDTVNLGNYLLYGELGYCLPSGDCPKTAGSGDFHIEYSEKESHFNVLLLTEPLANSRSRAGEFLLYKLGLNKEELCSLNYSVGTTYWVNEEYAGDELGFSFCPDSVSF